MVVIMVMDGTVLGSIGDSFWADAAVNYIGCSMVVMMMIGVTVFRSDVDGFWSNGAVDLWNTNGQVSPLVEQGNPVDVD